MMSNRDFFIREIAKYKPIGLAYEASLEVWGDDVPFLILCADIGKAIADCFNLFSMEEKENIFQIIEDAMNSDDGELSAAVATGLIEALYVKAEKVPSLLEQVDFLLGKEAKNYLSAWIKWQTE